MPKRDTRVLANLNSSINPSTPIFLVDGTKATATQPIKEGRIEACQPVYTPKTSAGGNYAAVFSEDLQAIF